jgi:uncharacterized protein
VLGARLVAFPFSQFVLKLNGGCDLACDRSHVREHADQSWRGRPLVLSEVTALRVVERVAEHASSHALPQVAIVLHGGEPLLYGAQRMRSLLELLRTGLAPRTSLDLRIHTNAVRLDRAFLELFLEFGVKVGVSLDGDQAANNLHRVFANGKTSHPAVLRALALLREPRYRSLYAGILCTIDLRNDPIRVYEALAAEHPPRADLLLPHATWDSPPLRTGTSDAMPDYAAWLGAVYDRWTADGRPFAIRTFDSITAALRGVPSQTEALGLTPTDLIVIETDGTYEQADSLKTAYDGAPATGLGVFDHSLDEAATHPGFAARQGGIESLCATCRACPVVEVCGGGLYAHRYRTGSGFDNPSAYCADLKAVIEHIRDRRLPADSGPATVAHALPFEDLGEFASGYGGADAVHGLGEPQKFIGRALITQIMDIARSLDADSPSAQAVAEIGRLDEAHPGVLATVLADPYTRVWAVRLLEATADGNLDQVHFARLAEIAAGAALLAGEPVRLPLHVVGGVVQLPAIGALALGGPDRAASIEIWEGGVAIVAAGGSKHEIHIGDSALGSAPEWLPRRRLASGPLSVAIEDVDPYRDCYGRPAAPRLSAADAEIWRDRFTAAVGYLESALPAYLPGLRAGLSTLTPLLRPSSHNDVSATARDASGAIGLALPADGPTLALLLIHEFQHVKLGALLDLYDFYDPEDRRLFYAPWREDPRPLGGLYQGTYAHLAVTEYWRVRRHDAPVAARAAAEANFVRWRTQTAEAVRALLGSKSLTALGEGFARGMGETLAPWLEEPVGLEAARAARRMARDHRAEWIALPRN